MRFNGPALRAAIIPTLLAGVLGNAFVGKGALAWFASLRQPRLQIPMPAFVAVGAVYYVELGVVLYRANQRNDRIARRLGWLVLAGNELWNAVFFGPRSTRNGFAGLLVFLVPLGGLQWTVRHDRRSLIALTPYTAWVVGYDLPWLYQLWKLNQPR
jgi:tryptophan-rich sensory protein